MSVEERYEMALRDLDKYTKNTKKILEVIANVEQSSKDGQEALALVGIKQIKKIIMGKWAE